jgi:hypothetical protein
MHIALNKLKKMNFNLKSGKQLKTSYDSSQGPVETILDTRLITEAPKVSKVPLEKVKKINANQKLVNQKQANLQSYFQKAPRTKKEKLER